MKHSNLLAERQIERERMQDVVLLIEHLVSSQETTFKLIIDCLYDVGSVNLINQKIKSPLFSHLTKTIASTSKPVFRIIAFYWVTRNCPKLVTNWLYGKVTFDQRDISQLDYPRDVVAQALEQYERQKQEQEQKSSDVAPPDSIHGQSEFKRLQGQIRVLQGMLVVTVLALGGAMWMLYDTRITEWSQRGASPTESAVTKGCLESSLSSTPHPSTSTCR